MSARDDEALYLVKQGYARGFAAALSEHEQIGWEKNGEFYDHDDMDPETALIWFARPVFVRRSVGVQSTPEEDEMFCPTCHQSVLVAVDVPSEIVSTADPVGLPDPRGAEIGAWGEEIRSRAFGAGVQTERERIKAIMAELFADHTRGWVALWADLEERLEVQSSEVPRTPEEPT